MVIEKAELESLQARCDRYKAAMEAFVTYDDCDDSDGLRAMLMYADAIDAARKALEDTK